MRILITGAVVAAMGVGMAQAKSLRDVAEVENGLFAIVVADAIRKECGSISARLLRARSYLRNLYDLARAEGYSDAEIDAYVRAESEKQRMEARRDAYLRTQGVVKSNPETYCAAGRAEIEKSSRIGTLLRAR